MNSGDNRVMLVEALTDAFQEYAKTIIDDWEKSEKAGCYVVGEDDVSRLLDIDGSDFDTLSDRMVEVLDDYGIVDIPEDEDLSYVDDKIEELRRSVKLLLLKKGGNS